MNADFIDYLFKSEHFDQLIKKDTCLEELVKLWDANEDINDQANVSINGFVEVRQVENILKTRLLGIPKSTKHDTLREHVLQKLAYCAANPEAQFYSISVNCLESKYTFVLGLTETNRIELVSIFISSSLDKDTFAKITGKKSHN